MYACLSKVYLIILKLNKIYELYHVIFIKIQFYKNHNKKEKQKQKH